MSKCLKGNDRLKNAIHLTKPWLWQNKWRNKKYEDRHHLEKCLLILLNHCSSNHFSILMIKLYIYFPISLSTRAKGHINRRIKKYWGNRGCTELRYVWYLKWGFCFLACDIFWLKKALFGSGIATVQQQNWFKTDSNYTFNTQIKWSKCCMLASVCYLNLILVLSDTKLCAEEEQDEQYDCFELRVILLSFYL